MRSVAGRSARAVLLVAVLAGSAAAQTLLPALPQECMALQDNAARLGCYDNALAKNPASADSGSLLDGRWELSRDSKRGVFRIRPYKPVYLAPFSWTSETNPMPHTPNPETTVQEPQDQDPIEAKYQISMMFKLAENLFGNNGDLWGAYTQSSRWQVYNSESSRPFRETDYEPEVILAMRTKYKILGWQGRLAGISLNHQSNGRGDPLSRSWNRIIAMIGLDRDGWALMLRPWLRIDESADDDDNPDISDYMGRADATLVRVWKGHQFSLMGRHSLRTGDRSHGALQFEWGFPIRGPLRGRLQVFDGYGESMIDYNHKATWVSAGFSLVEWY